MALPRHNWFQTDPVMTLTILKKGVALDQCKVSFSSEDSRRMTVRSGEDTIFTGQLSGEVKQGDITVTVTPNKVEIHLPKAIAGRWDKLLADEASEAPSSSAPKKNWVAIEKEAEKEEAEEHLEGDAAVHKMFKSLYANADDKTRRAMMKSYSESAGTVLSTNWDEISKQKTQIKPPDSMEYKRYDQ